MNFNEYQRLALTTAKQNPVPVLNELIWASGIAGEAGETLDKYKKIAAYQNGELYEGDLEKLIKEGGDVLWYLAVFFDSLGVEFSQVAETNIEKLRARKERGMIDVGEGDDR